MEDDLGDWSLEAVVRGCSATTTTTTSSFSATTTTTCSVDDYSLSSFQLPEEDGHFQCFPDLHEPRNQRNEELHDLYRPFFPKPPPLSPQNLPILPLSVLGELQDPLQPQQQKQLQAKQSISAQNPKSKRRKNQLKTVCEVLAEGLSSDVWSWRKYGQKPIKGSPFPRGYYKCSTLKGCLARKQVERKSSDPNMFIVTYTGEHNHPIPTHRNSLAGSTRNKPVTPETTTACETGKPNSSSPVSPVTTPLSPETEKTESREEEREDEDDDGLFDTVMSDDFFDGLEDLAGPTSGDGFSDHSPGSLHFPWLGSSSTTSAADGG